MATFDDVKPQHVLDALLAPKRRIYQIAMAAPTHLLTYTQALCSDGTLWELEDRGQGTEGLRWRRLPDIPQGEA
jgi:hypothetical protein